MTPAELRQLALAATGPFDDDDDGCRRCGEGFEVGRGLDPSAYCNTCAQELVIEIGGYLSVCADVIDAADAMRGALKKGDCPCSTCKQYRSRMSNAYDAARAKLGER